MDLQYTPDIQDLRQGIQLAAGLEFDIDDAQQLSDILYGKLGLPAADGNYSTKTETLRELQGQHEIIDLILAYRVRLDFERKFDDVIFVPKNQVEISDDWQYDGDAVSCPACGAMAFAFDWGDIVAVFCTDDCGQSCN